jgi:hypothetical protein
MHQMIHNALKTACDELDRLLKKFPLSILNQSVFRFFFVRNLLRQRKGCEVQLEWHRFDLLIQDDGRNILVEFKFHTLPTSHNLAGDKTWRKGGPGKQNFEEFKSCIRKLATVEKRKWRRSDQGKIHGKYLILAYLDDSRYRARYDAIADRRRLKRFIVAEEKAGSFGDGKMICKLIEIR